MRNYLTLSTIGALALLAGCQTMSPQQQQANEPPPPANPAYAGEMAKFNAQFPNPKATKYEDISINYNNNLKLDEKGNCHDLSKYPVIVVLVLDAQGKVTNTTADVQNAKADCFRQTYASAQFPPPPFAPYRKPIKLR
jgi:hypothetical protein